MRIRPADPWSHGAVVHRTHGSLIRCSGYPSDPLFSGHLLHVSIAQGDLSPLLNVLETLIKLMKPHRTSDSAKRRRKGDAVQVARALRATTATAEAPNALVRRVLPLMSRSLCAELPPAPTQCFATTLTATTAEQRTAKLRPGLQARQQATDNALRALLTELGTEAGEALRTGTASCPRTGSLRPPPERRPSAPAGAVARQRHGTAKTNHHKSRKWP